ncbi:MAG: hypothetical protein FJ130_10050 [Deltaproteobacteria bacterium]|nr:hypothetical protein [Deltaproteobacteria bacterium]
MNCHLGTLRAFYDYLYDKEGLPLINPVKKAYRLRLAKPLPKHLKNEQATLLFKEIKDVRYRAMFMLMLRCGLRVEEVARLTIDAMGLTKSLTTRVEAVKFLMKIFSFRS